MSQGGFLDTRKSNPVGLGLVVAGHVAVLTAIALAPPEPVVRYFFPPTIVDSIADPAPPLPDIPPPTPRAEPQAPRATVEPLVKSIDLTPLTVTPQIPQPQMPPIEPVRSEPVVVPPVIDPSALARFQPDYPPELIRADIEGTATVRVLIGNDGRVRAVELVNATQPGFFEATRKQALRFWKFKPGTRDGIATESWRTMTVRFTIQS